MKSKLLNFKFAITMTLLLLLLLLILNIPFFVQRTVNVHRGRQFRAISEYSGAVPHRP